MTRIRFTFFLSFFAHDGKFVSKQKHEYRALVDARKLPIMQHVKSHFRGLRDSGGQPSHNDFLTSWPGHILIECTGCSPELLPARE